MKKSYDNRIIIQSLGLPEIKDIQTFSESIGLTEKLIYWLSLEDNEEKYKLTEITKSNGKIRKIYIPCCALKVVQRWILYNILYKIKDSEYSYGFKKNKNKSPLRECAEKHKNNLYILKLDIKDFYPSITRKKVFYQFLNMGYNIYTSNLLTNICTINDELPQGAVTSAYLANLVCFKMDIRISSYCNKRDIVYTRYADDLTFSSDNRDELRNIYGMVNKILENEGFKLNTNKTQFLTPKTRKSILGLTVNDGNIKVSKKMKRTIRAMIYTQIYTANYSNNSIIKGYISYIDSIEKGYKQKMIDYIKTFYDMPITICEEIVKAFNKNKLFKELPDMIVKKTTDFLEQYDESELYSLVYEKRENLIKKYNKKIDL